ncbi:hypothetical protein TARUN_4086 [Trichoderma arundinaceum]|uniref:Zn(2)-C6 fungal-type domain-containing protein n=1 Tax=Trichoderma arundinaceum TaxID=490622 RepID=A0A395NQD4_TRIAR|nr:hypothetical protein TARUN_4086 [Trichoderma arundinaceum]
MSSKANSDKQQQCWECLRRRLACDGCHPVCDCCRSAGIVCPGYEDRRPLTWVTPGNVTVTRIRRSRTAAGATPTAAAATKKFRLQIRPQLLSPPPERSSTKSDSEAASVVTSVSDGKATEDESNTDVIALGGSSDRDGDSAEVDDEGETTSDSSRTPSSEVMISPQSRATSLAIVSQTRRWSNSTHRRSTNSIPLGLRADEFELMEAVEYCVLLLIMSYPNHSS